MTAESRSSPEPTTSCSSGFRFTCVEGCTACCDRSGYVYLTEEDLRRAAAHVGLSARAFEKKYVYRTRHLLRLRKPRGSQCHFLTGRGCSIHPVKPTQCRTYPFWPEIVKSGGTWKREGRFCPGIGQGGFVPLSEVFRSAHEIREAYPGVYSEREDRC